MDHDGLASYRDELTPATDIAACDCLGHFGYGDGRVVSAQVETPLARAASDVEGRPAYPIVGGCSPCARRDECWQQTRARAAQLMPELQAIEDALVAAGATGADLIRRWLEETGQLDESTEGGELRGVMPPALTLNAANMRLGAQHTVDLVTGAG